MTIMITGGAGFIGINFVKYIRRHTTHDIIVVDKMGYASNQNELDAMGIHYEIADISDKNKVSQLFEKYKIKEIIHFAAESHVDNSIKDSTPFVQSNVVGTVNLLDQSVKHNIEKFLHISTDEVFGEISYPEKFNEYSNIVPRNPYSASKASAEHFVVSYGNTYKLSYMIINSSNNYGPFQFPEKLIPLTVSKILKKEKIPLYGKGDAIRDWIYVEDTCEIILKIFLSGTIGSRYCIGGDNEVKNIDLVSMIIQKMNASTDLISYVNERPGIDMRYATDISKVKEEFNWHPKTSLSDGLDKTIDWICRYEDRI